MRRAGLLLGFIFVASVAVAYEDVDKMMAIEPGMKKDDVLQIIGPPDSFINKSVNSMGKDVEVYRYDYKAPPTAPPPAKDPFIKAEFGRDAKDVVMQAAQVERELNNSPPYLILFVNGVVQSVAKG